MENHFISNQSSDGGAKQFTLTESI